MEGITSAAAVVDHRSLSEAALGPCRLPEAMAGSSRVGTGPFCLPPVLQSLAGGSGVVDGQDQQEENRGS